jgi:agmatine deiminase
MSQRKVKILDSRPIELGYSFPPEWHPHSATWITWPRPEGISFPDFYERVPDNLVRIIKHIVPREKVCISVPNGNWQRIVEKEFEHNECPLENVRFFHIPSDEAWCRDHGPAFVLRKHRSGKMQAAIIDWDYNAWGRKYPRYEDDDLLPVRVGEALELPVFQPNIVMEGGSVDFNGAGTILTTESCLLNHNRNPNLSKRQIENRLKAYYGQKHVIWLKDGIVGDDTDGHIDDFARFIAPGKVVIAVEHDKDDENYDVLQENLVLLRKARDQDGKPLEVIEIPMPDIVELQGQRLPASYANFYFVNGALLVPTYDDKKRDRRALEILQSHLNDRQVIGIDCRDLIWGLGAIHCLTQQQPAW